MNQIRKLAFWPPLVLMMAVIIFNFTSQEAFYNVLTAANDWILANVGWFFSVIAVLCLLACIAAYFSDFGKIKIGGSDAKPMISTFSWFALSLTTTCASGILFWGPAEPISHIGWPPTEINGIMPNTPEAVKFAMETMYLHWTIIPYAIYAVPTVVFAFMYYNAKKPFSISSMVSPIFGKRAINEKTFQVIDAMTLFCICAGMAGSMGQVVMNISGGVNFFTGMPSSKFVWLVVTVVIAATVILTAVSGLLKGMKLFANINIWGYIILLAFLFLFGPSAYFFNLGTEAMGGFLTGLFDKALVTGAAAQSVWSQWWTVFYWASWMAWAPTTAIFLGRISYGRTIRSCLAINLFLNAAVGALWMTIMSGTAINFQVMGKADLVASYAESGAENIPYLILGNLPLSQLTIPLFLILIFLTIVTAANGNTSAMAGLSTFGVSPDAPEPPKFLKIIWALVVPAIAYIMISLIGLNGVKVVANFGGVVAVIIQAGALASLLILIKNHQRFNIIEGRCQEVTEGKSSTVVSNQQDITP